MGGNFPLKLNIGLRPIAKKYLEGKMKRTLERELKVPEIAKREANGTSLYLGLRLLLTKGNLRFRKGRSSDLDVGGVSLVEVSSCVGCSRIIAWVSGLASVFPVLGCETLTPTLNWR